MQIKRNGTVVQINPVICKLRATRALCRARCLPIACLLLHTCPVFTELPQGKDNKGLDLQTVNIYCLCPVSVALCWGLFWAFVCVEGTGSGGVGGVVAVVTIVRIDR